MENNVEMLNKIYKEIIDQGGREELAKQVCSLMKTEKQSQEMLDWLIENRKTEMTRDYPLIKALKIHNKEES